MTRSSAWRWPLALALAAAAALSCGGDPETFVMVTLRARPTQWPLEELRLTLSNEGATRIQSFSLGAGDDFPMTFTVTAPGRTGELDVSVEGFEESHLVARGSARVALVERERADLELTLEPQDFVVNQTIAGKQWLSFFPSLGGRQLAVAPDGTFLVTWENDCPLDRCDLVARLFGADTLPRRNEISKNTDDFIVNQTPQYTETPAAAASGDAFMLAWAAADETLTQGDIMAAALGFDGAHLATGDTVVSASPVHEQTPAVFALADGRFVVVWVHVPVDETSGMAISSAIWARVFDPIGAPLGEAFAVSTATADFNLLPHGVGLTDGQGGGFVVVWEHYAAAAEAVQIKARVFDSAANSLTSAPLSLTSYTGRRPSAPHVAATAEGFVAGWGVIPVKTPRYGSVVVRRFDAAGAALSTDITVGPSYYHDDDYPPYPVLAVRADGTIGAAWHDSQDGGDGSGFGVQFRLLGPSGMPIGPAGIAHTTLASNQDTPALAVLGDAFLIAFDDSSATYPDTDLTAVRARAIYPSSERHDGTIGAACGGAGDLGCGEGLLCQPAGGGEPRTCHPTCSVDGSLCEGGGVCNGTICLFE